jgi:tripartite-type tricarboxylate transporter receptor subunit TctC
MRPNIQRLLLWALLLASPLAVSTEVLAQTTEFPSRPIKIVTPYAPGGPGDSLARVVAQALQKKWGQPVVVENRPGAGGVVGVMAVIHSPADGYTLGQVSVSNLAIAPHLDSKLPYDPLRDLAGVAEVAKASYVLSVNPRLPAKNLRELIALARSRKGTMSYGSGGPGSMTNLAGELLKVMAGVDILQVPYKGTSPALAATLGGQIDMSFPDIATVKPFAQAGKLRMLAVTGATRSDLAPEVPTIAEAGVEGYAVDVWLGIVAPAGTPKNIVAKLNAALTDALKDPEFRRHLADRGFDAAPGSTPEQFAATIKTDLDKFGRIIKTAGIKPTN